MLPLLLAFASPTAAQVLVDNPTPTPRASEGWSVDVGVSARSLDSPPWLIVGTEQHVADNVWIRGALEGGAFVVDNTGNTRVAAAALVGPRFALNPHDELVASVYALGGIGARFGALDESVELGKIICHGTLRGGASLDYGFEALDELLGNKSDVNVRLSSDVVEGRMGWLLGAPTLPADKRIRDSYATVGLAFTPTLTLSFAL